MHNAYETLGVSNNAGEVEIRSRYLQLVRDFPPDRAPEKFAEIRAAYDELRNPIVQLERKLFSLLTQDSLDDLRTDLCSRLKTSKIPVAVLLSLADAS
jgi:preprotein translocase subunit Sec63